MKRILIAVGSTVAFYGLMFLASTIASQAQAVPATLPVTPPESGTPSPTATPSATPTPTTGGHATGGVEAAAGGATLKFMFTAKGDVSGAKGNVTYSNSAGEKFWGDVNICYVQSGNTATFAGTVTKGSTYQYFQAEVIDNGEGAKQTSPDALRVILTNTLPDCTASGVYPGVVTKGNIQVHTQ